jgi:hypothetical protein
MPCHIAVHASLNPSLDGARVKMVPAAGGGSKALLSARSNERFRLSLALHSWRGLCETIVGERERGGERGGVTNKRGRLADEGSLGFWSWIQP